MTEGRQVTVMTHSLPEQTGHAVQRLIAAAQSVGATLRFDAEETAKHGLPAQPGVEVNADVSKDVALCVVLGGDGTILRALRHYACTRVPVFAVNFGEVGFLATVTQENLDEGIERALAGEFELLHLPAILVDGEARPLRAFNDVAAHRKAGDRVAKLAYALDGEEVGSARCDGLVVATPAGSTGYNLANGGPVMAWGVAGFVVSFIAPHSLTARALVAAPANDLMIHNRSRDALELAIDGHYAGDIAPGESLHGRFEDDAGTIAQLPGYSFYERLREKFGLLAH